MARVDMKLSYVTIVWSVEMAVALLLGAVYLLVWTRDRSARASLPFSIFALSVAGLALIELAQMHAGTPQEWVFWLRLFPIFESLLILGMVVFVWFYLGTGRTWLFRSVIALRIGLLFTQLLTQVFTTNPTIDFREVKSIDRVPFLGETVSVVGQVVLNPWQWIEWIEILFVTAFLADASMRAWRKGGAESKRAAAVIGGSCLVGFVGAATLGSFVAAGLRMPVFEAGPFLVPLCAMAFELSRDILRNAQLARELSESRLRLELAADAAGLGLWERDAGRDQFWATERARTLLGLSLDGAIDAERWLGTVHPDDAYQVRRAWLQALHSQEEYAAEYRICLTAERVRWVAVRARPERDRSGEAILMRGVIRDVTEQRQAQAKLDELQYELAHAGRVSMLGQLASAITHELSRPLGSILRNADVAELSLRESSPDLDELRLITADIHRGVRHAGEVIERLRALLKHRRMDLQPIEVESLVLDVSALVRPDAVARDVQLQLRLEPHLPRVAGDRVHLSQVLINLIINAMDAIADSTANRCVTIEALSTPDGLIKVAVIDSGSGVPAESIARVFEPFFTTKSTGMGMGLSISRTIIEAHGGRIWVESNVNGGATFAFTLPAAEAQRQPVHPHAA
jgi:PAS domain S-box-containing protein